jgi:Holliday junction DNA helicase RuvB
VWRLSEHLEMPFDDQVCTAIAKRGLGVPRICLRHAERVRDITQARHLTEAGLPELELAMNIEGVYDLGLHAQHRLLLSHLAQSAPRPLPARSLALALGAEVATVTGVLEPPLVRLGLITIGTGGRMLTEAGRAHLKVVKDTTPARPFGEHSASN